jgi:predicted short-subunit dehydrogenase-like oxidoreductase (DUF2520 family)
MTALTKPESISVIGTGRVGRCLTLALLRADFPIHSLFNRTVSVAEDLVNDFVKPIVKGFPESKDDLGKITFLCVPDDSISQVAEELSGIKDEWSGYSFVHCSGARPAEELDVLAAKGARIASFHPIQTFPSDPDPEIFRDIWISLQGDKDLLHLLEGFAESLGAKTVQVTSAEKQQLHVAAVFACNYMVTIAGAAKKLLPDENRTMELLAPLMRQTLDQILTKGPGEALTGPLRRGDLQTLRNHLQSLNDLPELQYLYTSLGRYTVTLIKEMTSRPVNIDQISKLFETK